LTHCESAFIPSVLASRLHRVLTLHCSSRCEWSLATATETGTGQVDPSESHSTSNRIRHTICTVTTDIRSANLTAPTPLNTCNTQACTRHLLSVPVIMSLPLCDLCQLASASIHCVTCQFHLCTTVHCDATLHSIPSMAGHERRKIESAEADVALQSGVSADVRMATLTQRSPSVTAVSLPNPPPARPLLHHWHRLLLPSPLFLPPISAQFVASLLQLSIVPPVHYNSVPCVGGSCIEAKPSLTITSLHETQRMLIVTSSHWLKQRHQCNQLRLLLPPLSPPPPTRPVPALNPPPPRAHHRRDCVRCVMNTLPKWNASNVRWNYALKVAAIVTFTSRSRCRVIDARG